MAERGEVISTLGPATRGCTASAGWEHGGLYAVVDVCARPISSRSPMPVVARTARNRRRSRRRSSRVYDRVRAVASRASSRRPRGSWDERLTDVPQRYVYVVERDGRIDGYVVVHAVDGDARLHGLGRRSRRGRPRHRAHVVAAPRRARRAGRSVTVAGVPLDTLALLLPEQTIRAVGQQIWMTRIVDARGRDRAAGLPDGVRAEVTFRLVDPMVAANDGCWRLVVDGGEGRLEPLDPKTRARRRDHRQRARVALHRLGVERRCSRQSGMARGTRAEGRERRSTRSFGGRRARRCATTSEPGSEPLRPPMNRLARSRARRGR